MSSEGAAAVPEAASGVAPVTASGVAPVAASGVAAAVVSLEGVSWEIPVTSSSAAVACPSSG